MLIVDPWKLKVSDLTGNERVGVINWTTKEKVKINLKILKYLFCGTAGYKPLTNIEET